MKKSKFLLMLLASFMTFELTSCNEVVVGPTGSQGDQGIQGPAGENGNTPYIGSNGNWWINNQDTGIKAEGEKGDKGDKGDKGEPGKDGSNGKDGLTPYIGEDGNWWIGDKNTHVPATGPKGDKGEQGIPGENESSNNPYKGLENKTLSILGDSISTFKGTMPEGYASYYPSGDVTKKEDLWWDVVCKNRLKVA